MYVARLSRLTALAAVALSLAFAAASGSSAHAAPIGFEWGMGNNGNALLRNTSATASITGVEIDLIPGIVFDTVGTGSLGWSVAGTVGGVGALFPSNASTDGDDYASIAFTSFDAGDEIVIRFDLDPIGDDFGTGIANGTLISVAFSTGDTLSGTVIDGSIASGCSCQVFDHVAQAEGYSSTVAEPGTLASFMFGLTVLGAVRRRRSA